MPELPEVRTVCKALNSVLKGKTIADINIKNEKLIKDITTIKFKKTLVGKSILTVKNKGKFIVFYLSEDFVLLSHLRMEGKYHFEEWENSKHDHVEFLFTDKSKLFYNDTRQFGTFHLKTIDAYLTTKPLNIIGPEPAEADVNKIFDKLSKKKSPIKTSLLDQSLLSGLGNIYVDEVLWSVKLHPMTMANKISKTKVQEILESANEILEKATKAGGTTIRSYTSIDSTNGGYQEFLNVHTKAGSPCPRCKTKIEKIKVNGRGTYYCPKEQKII